jgi:hypothetical protein
VPERAIIVDQSGEPEITDGLESVLPSNTQNPSQGVCVYRSFGRSAKSNQPRWVEA